MHNAGDRLLHPWGKLLILVLQAVSSDGEESVPQNDKREAAVTLTPSLALHLLSLCCGRALTLVLRTRGSNLKELMSPVREPKAMLIMCRLQGGAVDGGETGSQKQPRESMELELDLKKTRPLSQLR